MDDLILLTLDYDSPDDGSRVRYTKRIDIQQLADLIQQLDEMAEEHE